MESKSVSKGIIWGVAWFETLRIDYGVLSEFFSNCAYNPTNCFLFSQLSSNMSGRNIWINFEVPQQYIRYINSWKKCSNLMQFLKYLAEPFLRPLRSKDVPCWILRLRPRNFAIISESLAANLETVRHTSVWQTVPKFWFFWLWYISFCNTY